MCMCESDNVNKSKLAELKIGFRNECVTVFVFIF